MAAMSVIERYRVWHEHERDSNAKMLGMIQSVPADRRDDPRFARAVSLAGHLAACRENWLDLMTDSGADLADWSPKGASAEGLLPRFEALESRWSAYLARLDDSELTRDFEFAEGDGNRYRWNIEGQVYQLLGHADYHRGQIALLVDQLGGETVETDYVNWAIDRNPHYGIVGPDTG